MSYPGSSIERIRDTSVSSKYGLVNDLGAILTEIYKDDVLQPKQNNTLRLQDYTIKTWFGSSKLNVAKDAATLNRLLELMLQTNDKTIADWAKKLEDSVTTKAVIQRDLLRFEAQIDCFEEWQRLVTSQNKKKTADSPFQVDQICATVQSYAPDLHPVEKAQDW